MQNAQLTIADLASLKQLIDAACTRGTFRASEMKSVGDIYDKLSAFLDAIVAQQKAQATEQAQPQGDQNA
jgi:hypothetical protein